MQFFFLFLFLFKKLNICMYKSLTVIMLCLYINKVKLVLISFFLCNSIIFLLVTLLCAYMWIMLGFFPLFLSN